MSYSLNFKSPKTRLVASICVGIATAIFLVSPVGAPGQKYVEEVLKSTTENPPMAEASAKRADSKKGTAPPVSISYSYRLGVITTTFWVGESASGANGHIANTASAWDGQWLEHFGGVDNPKNRDGYLPFGFTPKENPFYVALPYSDLDDAGRRKVSAVNCPLALTLKSQPYSWCKNSWLAIRHNGKTAYAQWQDGGPFGENDTAYVFGGSAPANQEGEAAGLDVSPALRDYLGLDGVDKCDWVFVGFESVPEGPWKHIITSSRGEQVNE